MRRPAPIDRPRIAGNRSAAFPIAFAAPLALAATATGLLADTRSGGRYAVSAESVDSGGRQSAAGPYLAEASMAGFASMAGGNGAYAGIPGYVAQLNRPPAAGPVRFTLSEANGGTLPESALLAAATDPDGDLVLVSGVDALSAKGGTVLLGQGLVTCRPAAGTAFPDTFQYTVRDDSGDVSTGVVSVEFGPSLSLLFVEIMPDGRARIVFRAPSGQGARVDSTDDLSPPAVWTPLPPARETGQPGVLEALDMAPPASLHRFYRALIP